MKAPCSQPRTVIFAPILLCAALAVAVSSCFVPPQSGETEIVYNNYVPPPWAPPYDNISTIRYYYFPDYDMFYDVWDGVFCYQSGDAWICSPTLPPMYADLDLYGVFIVLVHHNDRVPWEHYRYFAENYPHHCYDQYGPIVEHNRIVPHVPKNHRLVPRAFNENSNRVTFMQHPVVSGEPLPNPPPTPPDNPRGQLPTPGNPGSGNPARGNPAPARPAPAPSQYSRQVQEIPMRIIAPSMPAASKNFNYGSGYTAPPPRQSATPSKQKQQ